MDAPKPEGIGTAVGESLSSYVQRLCWMQGGMPGQLVFRLLSWLDKGDAASVGAWSPRPGRLRIGCNNNSHSVADVWVRLIHQLTARADVSLLTTRSWDRLFPTRGFAASTLAWCAPCLTMDRVPYHRLASALQPVDVCLECGRRLQRRCMRCGKMPPVLHDRSYVTRCPWCAADLRVADERLTFVPHDHFDFWAAAEVGAIIAASGQCHRAFNWNPQRSLRALCAERGLSLGAFARTTGTAKLTAWFWLHGKARPSLPAALRVYHRFGLSLAAELLGERQGPGPDLGSRQFEINLRTRQPPRKFDWDKIREELQAALRGRLDEAPTFISVAERLKIARRTLRAHEPVLCAQISRRHRERVQLDAEKRAEILAAEIARALSVFILRGTHPTWRELADAMGRPGLFNSRYARRILYDARFFATFSERGKFWA